VAGLDPIEIRKKLVSKFGFEPDGGTRHDTFVLTLDGRAYATTQVQRHKKDIGPKLYKYMALQCGVGANQFAQMIRCTIGKDQYLSILGYEPESAPTPRPELPDGGTQAT
jgi:hypothetical protein